jgi:hypothetical protein
MSRLGLIITVALALTALYYLSTTLFKPAQPQVIVVRPSGAQSASDSGAQTQTQAPPPPLAEGACTKAVFLKVSGVSLCADVIYSVVKTDSMLQVDFQGGTVQGFFMFASAPSCAVTTMPQGVFIPCRAQILIQLKQ